MRSVKLLISVVLLTAVIVSFDSCKSKGEDPGPNNNGNNNNNETEKERAIKLLTSGKWKLTSLTIDGVASSSYPDLNITFTSSGYTSTGGEPAWPASGTWAFTADDAKAIKRNDQTVVDIESIDSNNLRISFTWTQTGIGPGRISAVGGKHVFVMGK